MDVILGKMGKMKLWLNKFPMKCLLGIGVQLLPSLATVHSAPRGNGRMLSRGGTQGTPRGAIPRLVEQNPSQVCICGLKNKTIFF